MARIVVVDGSDICRAPAVAFLLHERLARIAATHPVEVLSRGLEALPGETMCEVAAARLGFGAAAIARFGSHRARPLTYPDIGEAALVLTASLEDRSTVVRMLPGTQAKVFTWKEALVLAEADLETAREHGPAPTLGVADLANLLHATRGTLPRNEPSLWTGAFHWRPLRHPVDPLTVVDGHEVVAHHRRSVDDAAAVAGRLGTALAGLLEGHPGPGSP